MKRLLKFSLIIGCVIMFSASTVSAQDLIKNVTACKFLVKVGYGPIGPSCTVTGYLQMISYPNTSVSIGVPAGNEIKISKGIPVSPAANCPFYVGLPCSPYPLVDNVACAGACGNYTAEFFVGSGIKIY